MTYGLSWRDHEADCGSAFKAGCLSVIQEVQSTGEPVVITKRGAPVVQVTRGGFGKGDVFGFMAGEFKIVGDIESNVFSEKKRISETGKGRPRRKNRRLGHPQIR